MVTRDRNLLSNTVCRANPRLQVLSFGVRDMKRNRKSLSSILAGATVLSLLSVSGFIGTYTAFAAERSDQSFSKNKRPIANNLEKAKSDTSNIRTSVLP